MAGNTSPPIPLAHIITMMEPPFDPSIFSVTSSGDSLPTISGRANECFFVEDDVETFLDYDLDLSRLNKIHNRLWMAGRPMRARPLHRYIMMGHSIMCTQQMDLHLLKFSSKLLLKPLPIYLLNDEFWRSHICLLPKEDPGHDGTLEKRKGLHKSATGFLLSYVWLITSPLDLTLAQKEFHLIPETITWDDWKRFVRSFLTKIDMNTLDQVNIRYHFGDLRLGRVNSIYRIFYLHTHFVRGYLYGYNRYVVFFERNFSWILIVFVFFSMVLGAMQVGISLNPLEENDHFRRASYGFVVFSIVSVAVVLAVVIVLFGIVFLFNMGAAIKHDNAARRKRKKLAKEKKRTS